MQLIQELMNGMDAGDFADVETIPDKYTYAHLWALFQYAEALDGGRDLYEYIFDLAVRHGKMSVQKKSVKAKK